MIEFISDLLIHVSIFLIFITVFYMTFVRYIQNLSLANEVKDYTKTFTDLIGVNSTPGMIKQYEINLKNFNPSSLTDPDVTAKNNSVVQMLTLYVGIVSGLLLLIGLVLAYFAGKSFIEIIYMNAITIIFIAITDSIILAIFGTFKIVQTSYLIGTLSSNRNKEGLYSWSWLECKRPMNDALHTMLPSFGSLIDKIVPYGSN